PDRGGDDLDDVHADEVEPRRELARCPQEVPGGHASRLGGPGPGCERGIEHVDVDGEEDRTFSDGGTGALDDLADAELADVMHEERGDPVLVLPCELGLARPV